MLAGHFVLAELADCERVLDHREVCLMSRATRDQAGNIESVGSALWMKCDGK